MTHTYTRPPVAPTFCCGRGAAGGDRPYFLRPLRSGFDSAFRLFPSVRLGRECPRDRRSGYLIALAGTAFCAVSAQAHHAASAVFSDETIEIEGIVTEFNFKNPHVNILINVTDDSGAETLWMATAPAPVSLRRSGWSADSIRKGQYLRITGMKSLDGGPMILAENETWDEGGIVQLDPVDGSVIGPLSATVGESPTAFSSGPLAPRLSDGRPNFTGTWRRDRNAPAVEVGRNSPPFNERGAAVQAGFAAVDDPAFSACTDNGLVRQAASRHPLTITQYPDRVQFDYEEGAAQRVFYLHGRGPETDEKTGLGHSVARYEGDTLIIETTQVLGNLTGTRGNAVSDRHTAVETYRRIDDENGPVLEMVMVVTDPEYLSGPWEMSWRKRYAAPGYVFTEVDCLLPFRAAP